MTQCAVPMIIAKQCRYWRANKQILNRKNNRFEAIDKKIMNIAGRGLYIHENSNNNNNKGRF